MKKRQQSSDIVGINCSPGAEMQPGLRRKGLHLAIAGALACVTLAPLPAAAADMHVNQNQVILSGPLFATDADRFRAILEQADREGRIVDTVIMRNMPGGNIGAGQIIGKAALQRNMTIAPMGGCTSQCQGTSLYSRKRAFAVADTPQANALNIHGASLPHRIVKEMGAGLLYEQGVLLGPDVKTAADLDAASILMTVAINNGVFVKQAAEFAEWSQSYLQANPQAKPAVDAYLQLQKKTVDSYTINENMNRVFAMTKAAAARGETLLGGLGLADLNASLSDDPKSGLWVISDIRALLKNSPLKDDVIYEVLKKGKYSITDNEGLLTFFDAQDPANKGRSPGKFCASGSTPADQCEKIDVSAEQVGLINQSARIAALDVLKLEGTATGDVNPNYIPYGNQKAATASNQKAADKPAIAQVVALSGEGKMLDSYGTVWMQPGSRWTLGQGQSSAGDYLWLRRGDASLSLDGGRLGYLSVTAESGTQLAGHGQLGATDRPGHAYLRDGSYINVKNGVLDVYGGLTLAPQAVLEFTLAPQGKSGSIRLHSYVGSAGQSAPSILGAGGTLALSFVPGFYTPNAGADLISWNASDAAAGKLAEEKRAQFRTSALRDYTLFLKIFKSHADPVLAAAYQAYIDAKADEVASHMTQAGDEVPKEAGSVGEGKIKGKFNHIVRADGSGDAVGLGEWLPVAKDALLAFQVSVDRFGRYSYRANDPFAEAAELCDEISGCGFRAYLTAVSGDPAQADKASGLLGQLQFSSHARVASLKPMLRGDALTGQRFAALGLARTVRGAVERRQAAPFGANPAATSDGPHLWVDTLHGQWRMQGQRNWGARRYNSDGLAIGVERSVGANGTLGAALTYARIDAKSGSDFDRFKLDGLDAALYGGWRYKRGRIDGNAHFARANTRYQRTSLSLTGKGDAPAFGDQDDSMLVLQAQHTFELPLSVAADKRMGLQFIVPRITHTLVRGAAFSESGSADALKISGHADDIRLTQVGAGLRFDLGVAGSNGWNWNWYAQGLYEVDIGGSSRRVSLSDVGWSGIQGPVYRIDGPRLDRDSTRLNLGAEVAGTGRWSFGAEYTREQSGHWSQDGLSARAAYRF